MQTISIKAWKYLATVWFITITVLFFLPGSALPKENWLNAIFFDKWVHFGFFSILLYSARFFFPFQRRFNSIILLLAAVYGLSVELIQHNFIANRSFDLWDVVADMAGAFAGLWFWNRRYIKK